MRTKLLGAFCLLFPLLSVAADIQRITPITSDNSVKNRSYFIGRSG